MKGANYRVVLDACVLANHGICDLFLRLAERPRLYSPIWSNEILDETTRTHVTKLNWPQDLADHWRNEVQKHFAEALIEDASCLEPVLINDVKDRHVLATAIRAGATTIVTFNLRDFSATALAPWEIQAVHPAELVPSDAGGGLGGGGSEDFEFEVGGMTNVDFGFLNGRNFNSEVAGVISWILTTEIAKREMWI
jgi:predicted nucleic acid-binding protein